MPDTGLLLTFNTGSSTLKIGLFQCGAQRARSIGKGLVDFSRRPFTFRLTEGPVVFDIRLETEGERICGLSSQKYSKCLRHIST